MVTLVSGLIGGLIATIVMTVFMMMLGDDSPPPTALFWSKYIGSGSPDEHMMPGIILHLLYGTIAGGVFALLVPLIGFVSVASIGTAILWGLIYAVGLFIAAAVFWMKIILQLEADMQMAGMFLVFHLIYGLVLGAWIGTGILA